jgi:hypothetical protein
MTDRLPKGDTPEPDESDESDGYDLSDYQPSYFGAPPRRDRRGWLQNRREKAVAEITRNRAGEYKVPTWVLGTVLAVIVVFWALIVILN